MSSEDLIVVITGASRGFGRALAVVAAGSFQENTNLKIILVARSMEGLNTTAQHVRDQVGGSVNICCHSMDLGDLGHLDANFDKLCQEFETEAASSRRIIFIQNAGSIGHLGPCRDSPSLMAMQAYVDLNITSCLWTSARLAGYVKSAQIPTDMVIVSISSLVAIENFPTFGIYSAGKAARDKYHTLIAKEEAPEPSVTSSSTIRTLNYAPGPLETAMVEEIRENLDRVDALLQPGYRQKALDPMNSAQKLFRLLEANEFESGAHVDYFDLPEAN